MLVKHQIDEQRRFPRLPCSMRDANQRTISNLSESGIYFETESEFQPTEIVPVVFKLTSVGAPVKASGRIVWRRHLKSGSYGYGVHFEETSTEAKQQIRSFVNDAYASVTPEEVETIIIGGGITGMAAALALMDRAAERSELKSRVRLLEADHQLGGRLHSRSVGGMPYDAGAQFYAADSKIRDLIRRVGLQDQESPISPWQGVALDSKRIERFNLKKPWLGWGLQGLGGISALLKLPLKDIGFLARVLIGQLSKGFHVDTTKWLLLDNGETSGQWVRRTLGEKALNNLIGPFMAGILFADPEKTSKGLLAWFMATFLKKDLYTLKNGFGSLANVISARLAGFVETNARVTNVEVRADGKILVKTASMKSYLAKKVILTAPACVTSKIYSPLSSPEKSLLQYAKYSPAVMVTAATKNKHWRNDPSRGGIYAMFIPLSDSGSLIGIGMESAKQGRVADPDGEVVQLYFRPEKSRVLVENNATEDEIRKIAFGEAEKYFPGFSHSVVDAAVDVWPLAIPQFSPGYLRTLVRYRRYVEEQCPPVILAGDYTTLPGVESAYQSGLDAATNT